jgi:hypothetical protein
MLTGFLPACVNCHSQHMSAGVGAKVVLDNAPALFLLVYGEHKRGL